MKNQILWVFECIARNCCMYSYWAFIKQNLNYINYKFNTRTFYCTLFSIRRNCVGFLNWLHFKLPCKRIYVIYVSMFGIEVSEFLSIEILPGSFFIFINTLRICFFFQWNVSVVTRVKLVANVFWCRCHQYNCFIVKLLWVF